MKLFRSAVLAPLAIVLLFLVPTEIPRAHSQEPQVIPNNLPLNPYDYFTLTQELSDGLIEAGDQFGKSLAVGDFNNDGWVDLAAGAPHEAPGNDPASGVVILFEGSGGGPTLGAYSYLDQTDAGGQNEAGDEFGAALAVGNFNGDTYDDLAIGVPGEAPSSDPASGVVYIFFGSQNGLANGLFITQVDGGGQNEAGDEFGRSLAAGDLNGDTYDELAIGVPGEAPSSDPASGVVYIFSGSQNGLTNGLYITQEDATGQNEDGDKFGEALAVGNFNNDSYDDLAIGVPSEAPSSDPASGVVYIFSGSQGGLTNGLYLTQVDGGGQNEAGDEFGAALAVGNFDGNAYDDLAIGVPSEAPSSDPASGVVYIFSGSQNGLTNGLYLTQADAGGQNEAGDEFGRSLAAGDLNGDTYDELAIGVPGDAPGSDPASGVVYVFIGSNVGLSAANYFTQADIGGQNEAGDEFGAALALGNFNNDSYDDLAIGAPAEAPGSAPPGGVVFIVAGDGNPPNAQPVLTHGPLLGAVSATTIRIWVRADRDAQIKVQFKSTGEPWPGTTTPATPLIEATDFTGSVLLSDLAAKTQYDYQLLLDDVVVPNTEGTFTTVAAPTAPDTFTFAFGADLRFSQRPFPILDHIVQHSPDFAILMGDNIYADSPVRIPDDLDLYERQYKAGWAEPHFRSLVASVPTFMIWDDHELENNWDAGKIGRYVNAKAAYDEYQGSHNPIPRTPGENYYAFSVGLADFYVLDTRTFRSPNATADNANKTMIGEVQKADLKAWLSSAQGRFKFLVSSVPWQDAFGGGDAWPAFTTERTEIFNYIRDNCISGVVLLSGDQHWVGVARTALAPGYSLYEISPTPLGTNSLSAPNSDDPSLIFKYDADRVFGLIEVRTNEPSGLTINVIKSDNTSVYTLDLTEEDISPACIESPLANQTITFDSLSDKNLGDPSFTLNATASSGLPVTFESLTPGVCTINGNTVTLVSSGTCTIRASQAGNASFNPAPNVERTFVVNDSNATHSTYLPATRK